jgi:hypothetical protein
MEHDIDLVPAPTLSVLPRFRPVSFLS